MAMISGDKVSRMVLFYDGLVSHRAELWSCLDDGAKVQGRSVGSVGRECACFYTGNEIEAITESLQESIAHYLYM